jgi:hypothetical protein
MKTSLRFIFPIIFILFTFSFNSYSQQIKVVEINASALVEDKNTDHYSILIYSDGQLKDSIYCKKTKAITLSLESYKLYSIVFKKANYSDKVVIVDTKIPSGLREMVEEPFELQIELAKNATSKAELIDYPVAILSVSRKVKSLMASENYYKLTHE